MLGGFPGILFLRNIKVFYKIPLRNKLKYSNILYICPSVIFRGVVGSIYEKY